MRLDDDTLILGLVLIFLGDLFILATLVNRRDRSNNVVFLPKTTAQMIAQNAGREE